MSLGLKQFHGGGDFAPRIEYDAKIGALNIVHRIEQPDKSFLTEKEDVTMNRPEFMFDLGTIEIGWISFAAGPPNIVMVPYGQDMPARPSPKHKAGFKFKVWDGREAEARDFTSNAGVTVDAIEELWDAFTAAPEAARGMVPILQFTGRRPVKKGTNTNYAPVFTLVAWIERPDHIFGPRTVAPAAAAPVISAPTPPAPPSAFNGQAAPIAWQAPAPTPPPASPRAW